MLMCYFEDTAAVHGERSTLLQMRKFAVMYLKGFPGARTMRQRIQQLSTRAEFEAILDEVFAEGAPDPLVPDHERLRQRSVAG